MNLPVKYDPITDYINWLRVQCFIHTNRARYLWFFGMIALGVSLARYILEVFSYGKSIDKNKED